MRPSLSYTLWFTQRQGSTLLCELLESTGIAGRPNELMRMSPEELVPGFSKKPDYAALQEAMYRQCSTPNGVMGFKGSAVRDSFADWLDQLGKLPAAQEAVDPGPAAVWTAVFPNDRHIFLSRRNQIRLAVSWWKAIVTEEWHRPSGTERTYDPATIRHRYDRDAIRHLVQEIAFREAAIQDFFSAAGIQPLTLVYEDWITDPAAAVDRILDYLDLPHEGIVPGAPSYQRLADEVTEEWVERFRKEEQAAWERPIW